MQYYFKKDKQTGLHYRVKFDSCQDFSFCWNDGIEYLALIDRLALSRQLYEVQNHFYMVFSAFRQYQVVYARFKIFKNNGRY